MRTRRLSQIGATVLANPYFAYISNRTIYQGKAKGICFPGLNCYACPLAIFSCPIGSLQHSLAIMKPSERIKTISGIAKVTHKSFSPSALFYVLGSIGIVGAIFGRLPCGWICPFGLLQEVLYRIPVPKLKIPKGLRYLKYGSLLILSMLIPYITGIHFFSRYCPAGTLEGLLPLKVFPPKTPLPPGSFFVWVKIGILIFFLLWFTTTKRPFCRTACPLGAFYSLFNPVSLYGMNVDTEKCTQCNTCQKVCPVDIRIYENPNSPECIRCLSCKRECPESAITSGFFNLS